MALVNAYCSVAEVLTEVRNSAADTGQIENAIHAASRFIDRHKGRDYVLHDYSATPLKLYGTHKGIDGRLLVLPFVPIVTLTAVAVDGVTWTEGTDYVREEDWGLRAILQDWPVGYASTIQLTGTFGYAGASGVFDAPANIRKAAVMIAAAVSGHLRKDVLGLDGNIQSISDRSIPAPARELLGPPASRV